jgi:hypothetical protein
VYGYKIQRFNYSKIQGFPAGLGERTEEALSLQGCLSRRDSTLLTAGFNLRTAMESVPQVPQGRHFVNPYYFFISHHSSLITNH